MAASRSAAVPRSPAKARVVAAAAALFAEHGVGGTSLQMIADAIGVTKAAVYYQFNSKEEIVIAAAEDELARMTASTGSVQNTISSPSARAPAIACLLADRLANHHEDSRSASGRQLRSSLARMRFPANEL
jgi:AcrR family transcriptional regulator